MRRWAETLATGGCLALAAAPFGALFPEPPAFGKGAACILAAVPVLATAGTTFRTSQPRRRRILGRAVLLLVITAAAVGAHIILAATIAGKLPTSHWFGPGHDAVGYGVWLGVWLVCAVVAASALGLRRATRREPPRSALPTPWDVMIPQPVTPPWNGATILLWLVGWGILVGAVLDGHWTAEFLSQAVHVSGTVADPQSHPRIRFTTVEGTIVEYTQNGSVSRSLGAAVPVAYLRSDPAGSARADTFWANWSDLLALLWCGLGFTLFPFYGCRANFRAGRW